MAGVRVQHPTARNVRFTMSHPDQPYDRPYQCTPPEYGGCGQVHLFKTDHLNIDETGSAIVNDVLYERVKGALAEAGFRWANVVDKPPTMTIGVGMGGNGHGDWGNIPIIRSEGVK